MSELLSFSFLPGFYSGRAGQNWCLRALGALGDVFEAERRHFMNPSCISLTFFYWNWKSQEAEMLQLRILGEGLCEGELQETKLVMKVYPTGSSTGCILASLMLASRRKASLPPCVVFRLDLFILSRLRTNTETAGMAITSSYDNAIRNMCKLLIWLLKRAGRLFSCTVTPHFYKKIITALHKSTRDPPGKFR